MNKSESFNSIKAEIGWCWNSPAHLSMAKRTTSKEAAADLAHQTRISGSEFAKSSPTRWRLVCFLYASPLDQAGGDELLFSVGDADEFGWKQIAAVVTGLERSEIKTLDQRPIELADGTIVIGGD